MLSFLSDNADQYPGFSISYRISDEDEVGWFFLFDISSQKQICAFQTRVKIMESVSKASASVLLVLLEVTVKLNCRHN